MTQSAPRAAQLDDFWAIPEGERFHEFLSGEIVRRADPSAEHGSAQVGVVRAVAPPFQRRSGGGGPGGWWILTEVEVLLETGNLVAPPASAVATRAETRGRDVPRPSAEAASAPRPTKWKGSERSRFLGEPRSEFTSERGGLLPKDPEIQVSRPDVVGFRRERCPERPTGTPIKLRPDFICEIVSESNAHVDTVKKLRLYHQAGLPHYWLVDPRDSTLTVMRHSADGYVTLLRAERHEVVRAEPFDAIEIPVGTLFGDDPPEG